MGKAFSRVKFPTGGKSCGASGSGR
jgi:hypothetical protein